MREQTTRTTSGASTSAVVSEQEPREELLAAMLQIDSVEEMLHELVTRAARLTPGGSCSITIGEPRGKYTVAASDSLAAQVDEVQYTAGEGPCLSALRDEAVVDIPDLAAETRWSDYRVLAVSHGVAACHCVPLTAAGQVIGVLNLYAVTPRAFGPDDKQAVLLFASAAAATIAVTRRYAEKVQLSEQLAEALTSRSTIDHAIGVIMGQNRISADDAFALLRRASQNRNVKLRDIAAQIVRTYATGDQDRPGQAPSSTAPRHDPGRSN